MGHLDPVKRRANGYKQRHLAWTMLYTFRYEGVITSESSSRMAHSHFTGIMCVICAVAELGGSVGINQLLSLVNNLSMRGAEELC